MTTFAARVRLARESRDDGMGLILVIGISAFVFALAITASAYAVNGTRQSKNRASFEVSLATAEAGVDGALSRLQTAFSKYNSDYPIPNNVATPANPSPSCAAAPVTWPAVIGGTAVSDGQGNFFAAGARTAEQNERLWASTQLKSLVTISGCVSSAAGGQYVVLKPVSALVDGKYPKFGKVYSYAAVPSFATAGAKSRVVKSEYVFLPYRPTNAVLTGGDLEFQGALTVTTAAGAADTSLAGVHSNGKVTVTGNAANVTGAVTSTGSGSSASIGGKAITTSPAQAIPSVSARDFYFQAPGNDPQAMDDWIDLCPDGYARDWSANGPCTASTVLNAVVNKFNNWTYAPGTHTWTAAKDAVSGVYFIHEGNATNGTGNAAFPNMTVIASAQYAVGDTDFTNCSAKKYGNIVWDHYDIASPAYTNMWFYADSDVSVTANIKIGQGATTPPVVSGLIVSGDQTKLYTQSNSAVGAVIAADKCKTVSPTDNVISVNEIHSDLYFDPDAKAPFTSIITNTLWLDYKSVQ